MDVQSRRWQWLLLASAIGACSLDTSPLGPSSPTFDVAAPMGIGQSATAGSPTAGAGAAGASPDAVAGGSLAGAGAGEAGAGPGQDMTQAGGESPQAPADPGAQADQAPPAPGADPSSPAQSPAADPQEAAEPEDEGSLADWLMQLAAQTPQGRSADSLGRIASAMAGPASAEGIIDALDALDALGCRQNQEVCRRVCLWALGNCDACGGEAACVDALRGSCFVSCSQGR